ncbi:IS1634 family transposase, partial [bacterium]|nr:IS1634 family transposase [bacterium]
DMNCKRLDHLPLVAACMRHLEIAKTIDEIVPPHPLNHVTTGECVEAMVLSILTGEHALYNVSDVLSQYDTTIIFQKEVKPGWFHDNRLGNSLDDLKKAGLDSAYSGIISKAIVKHSLSLSQIHFDTTSLSFYGEYKRDEENPLVTYGYSKKHRPDLKQVLFGMTVTQDGNIPITGRITAGNTSDSTENRFNITSLRNIIPDLSKTILAADSKFFSGPTIELAYQNQNPLSFVTLVPKTIGLREELVKQKEDFQLLLTKDGRKKGTIEEYRGYSVIRPFIYELDDGRVVERTMRFLIVESTTLEKKKGRKIDSGISKEVEELSQTAKNLSKKVFACEKDATAEASTIEEKKKLHYHTLSSNVIKVEVPTKRGKGRPHNGEKAPTEEGWVVELSFSLDIGKVEEKRKTESRYVLASNILDKEKLPDDEFLKVYKGQSGVESNFKWTKNPAAVAPIFLNTDDRILALGFVYLVALMVYTLMERQIRKKLIEEGKVIKGNKGKTNNPTGEVLFWNLSGISVISYFIGDQIHKKTTNLTQMHELIISLFDFDMQIYQEPA